MLHHKWSSIQWEYILEQIDKHWERQQSRQKEQTNALKLLQCLQSGCPVASDKSSKSRTEVETNLADQSQTEMATSIKTLSTSQQTDQCKLPIPNVLCMKTPKTTVPKLVLILR